MYRQQSGCEPSRSVKPYSRASDPLDTRDDEIAYRRNRRIEFKLTEG